MDDLITIIIPVYNVEKYISKCIDSVVNQSYQNLEILLVDDGSTDESGNICDKYALNDSRINVIHKNNGGLSDARNTGLNVAKGKYIGFVDSDDYIDTDMYEELYNACIKYDSDIAMCGRRLVKEDGTVISLNNVLEKDVTCTPKEAISRLLVWDNCDSAAWDKLYNRKLFTDMRYPYGKLHEDLNVTCRLFAKCSKISQIADAKYNYLIRDDSICRQSFNEKRFDLYYQAKANQEFIYETFPDLKSEADYFVWHCTLGVMSSLVDSKETNRTYYKRVRALIKQEKYNLFVNKYVKFNEKIEYMKKQIKFHIQLGKSRFLR